MSRIPATVTILTFNSGQHLETCLKSVSDFEEILVLDGGSTDETLEIANRFHARVLPQSDTSGPIKNFTEIRKKSFDLARHEWVFWIDSDEYANTELIQSIRDVVNSGDSTSVWRASKIPVVEGKEIYHAYFLPDKAIRLVRKGLAEWASKKKVHEHLVPEPGVAIKDLNGHVFSHWDDLATCKKKDKRYIHLAFNKPVSKTPKIGRTLKSILKNIAYALGIFCIALYLSVRYRHTDVVLPIRHHLRFSVYHLRIVRERIRQLILRENYVPPKG